MGAGAGSEVERVGCFKIETGADPVGRVTEGAGEGADVGGDVAEDRTDVADEVLEGLTEAEAILGGSGAL